jgi:PAS domain S-box-containing protein
MEKEFYQQLVEAIDAVAWRFDVRENKWLYVSPQIERFLGYKPDEWMAQTSWDELLHPDDRLSIPEFGQTATNKANSLHFYCRFKHKQQGFVWFNVRIAVESRDEAAVLNGVMFAIAPQKQQAKEITAEATAPLNGQQGITPPPQQGKADVDASPFDELEQVSDRSAKLITDKNKLMSILSHDLKNPFNAILGFLELLSMNVRTYDIAKIETQINIINQSANRYYDILEQLVFWLKAQSDKITFYPTSVNLYQLCKDVIKAQSIYSSHKNITVDNAIAHDLTIMADEIMLQVIIKNLLSNALKFTPNGGHVTISAEVKGTTTEIAVADNGVGIDPLRKEHLFDLSKITLNKGTNNEPGIGLGLAICKELIEKHRGKIWVESEPGKGTVIQFSILSL